MRTQRGYSMIEVLIAFAILGLIITITMAAFLERNRRMKQANELIRAYQSLANEAELVRRRPYVGVIPAEAFSSPTDVLAPLESVTTEIEVVETKPGRKDVTLMIRWGDGKVNPKREAKLGLVRTETGGTNLW